MNIRQLTSVDAKMYWELRLEALLQNPEAFATSYEDAIQRSNPLDQIEIQIKNNGNHIFGAFENDRLIGTVTLQQETSEKLKHKGNIFAMYVTPGSRGQGIGKALLTKTLHHAKTIGTIEKINISVVTTNEAARNLYYQMGFTAFGVEEKSLKLSDYYLDEEHMSLFL